MNGDGFAYRVFISYSHADAGWGRWLHRELERFRAPRQLGEAAGRRLGRCFRDEAEMGAAAHLPEKIARALGASEWLVVICSPKSAASHWVNKEIADFKALGREDRVLALIVEGEPGGSRAEDAPMRERECFPDALRVRADGGVEEPLAVDVRKFGRADAMVRLVSEIIGVEYDALRQREVRRRRWALVRAQALFAAGLVLTAGALAGGYFAAQNYAASSAARSDLFAREANALFAEHQHAKAMLMALEGDPGARAGMVERRFDPEGYAPARHALSRAATYNRLARVDVRPGPGTLVTRVAFLPDGERYLTIDPDSAARLWKRGEAKPLAEFKTDSEEMNMLSLFPDGKSFLTNGLEGEVWLWRTDDPSSGKVIAEVDGLTALAAHPDGEHFLAASAWGPTSLWKIGESEPETEYPAASPGVWQLAIHADGKSFVTGSENGTLEVWRFGEMAPVRTYAPVGSPPEAIAFHPVTDTLITGSFDGVVRIWTADEAAPAATRTAGTGAITDVAFHPDGKRFAASLSTGEVVIWEDSEGAPPLRLAGPVGATQALAVSPNGELLLTGAMDGGVRLWTLDGDGSVYSGPAFETPRAMARQPDPAGKRMLVFQSNGGGGLLDAQGQFAPAFPEEMGQISRAVFTRDGEQFVTMTSNDAHLWRAGRQGVVQTFAADTKVFCAAIDPDGRHVLTGHEDGTVRLWRVGESAPVKVIKTGDKPVDAVAWHEDGVRFMTAASRAITLWRTDQDGAVMTRDAPGSPRDIVMSPDGSRFATTYGGNSPPLLWRVEEGEPTALGAQSDRLETMRFMRDGRHVAAMSKEGTVTVWELGDGLPMAFFGRHTDGDGALTVLPDDEQVTIALVKGGVRTWRMPAILRAGPEEQVRIACETLREIGVMDFSEADWLRFPILDRGAPHPCAKVWGFDPRRGGVAPGAG